MSQGATRAANDDRLLREPRPSPAPQLPHQPAASHRPPHAAAAEPPADDGARASTVSLAQDTRPFLNDEIRFDYTMDTCPAPAAAAAKAPRPPISREPDATPGMQPSHASSRPLDHSKTFYEKWMMALGNCMGFFGQVPGCFCCPNPMVSVPQGFVGLISSFGRYYKTVDPGLTTMNVLTEEIKMVDVRIQITEIPRQDIMTKDNVCVSIDSVVYWTVCDPYKAAFGITNACQALTERTQTTLRQTLGVRVLQDVIENREVIGEEIARVIDVPAHTWGIKVESILFKDLQFGAELRESLASAATQKRIGESKIIAARAEVEAAKLMREASDILNTKAAMQIRYLDTLRDMSRSSGSKIIFMPLTDQDADDSKPHGMAGGGIPAGVQRSAIMDNVSKM